MNWLERFYCWLWYHTEFWISNKIHRRPFTFIMRDWLYPHMTAFICIILAWSAVLVIISHWYGMAATILAIGSGLIIGHLIWGTRWIPGEQEDPVYNPDGGE